MACLEIEIKLTWVRLQAVDPGIDCLQSNPRQFKGKEGLQTTHRPYNFHHIYKYVI
jgi:hypothetical protein